MGRDESAAPETGRDGRSTDERSPFRALPSVATLVTRARVAGSTLADQPLAALVGQSIERERAAIAVGERPSRDEIEARVVAAALALESPRLAPALNATGVIIHTNLGRAPVSSATAAAMAAAASGAVALELEPETNERGGRMREIATLLRLLTGAEATLVVNNGAAAVLLALSALTAGRGVVVSRGEAVEIGGGFRVPAVMRQSGATLVEVGTTNRTYLADYLAATDETTAAWLKVHASNFRMTGFTHAVPIAELAAAARTHGVLALEDLGSGALLDTTQYGLAPEPTITASIDAGAHLVVASGDKLLGGPQAGIIAGERAVVEQAARHPLARAVRVDKTTLAGVAATLRHYARGEAEREIPVWRMIAVSPSSLESRAARLVGELCGLADAAPAACAATVGGGSLPGETLPSWGIALKRADASVDALARRLRLGTPAVFGRVEHDRVLLDLRTVLPEDDDRLLAAIQAALRIGGE